MNNTEIIILKTHHQMMKFKFYKLIDSQIDIERLTTNIFFQSKQHNNLANYQTLAKIAINDEIHVLGNYNVIPYITGVKESLVKPEIKRPVKFTKSTMKTDQGWQILDDLVFMAWFKAPIKVPGPVEQVLCKPQIKHSVEVRANMFRTRSFNSTNQKTWNSNPRLPDLDDLKTNLNRTPSSNDVLLDRKVQQSTPRGPPSFSKPHKQRYIEEVEENNEPAIEYTPQVKSIAEIAPFLRWGLNWDNITPIIEERPEENNIEELIPALVSETICSMDFFKVLKCDTTLIASAITSSLLAIGTSLHTLFTTESTTTGKILNSVAIVSSLTTFCLSLNKLFDTYNIPNRINEVHAELPSLARGILNSQTKANSLVWIYPAISSLIAIVVASLTAFNVCDAKSIIEKGRLLTSTKAIGTTAKDVTKFLLEDIAGLDVTGDQKIFAELHEWAKVTSELSVLSVMEFIQNPELNAKIHSAVSTTIPLITHKYANKDLSHAARGAYQLILSNVSKLQEKIEAIDRKSVV